MSFAKCTVEKNISREQEHRKNKDVRINIDENYLKRIIYGSLSL